MTEPGEGAPAPETQGNWNQPAAQTPPALKTVTVEAGPAPGVAYADVVTRVIAAVIDSIVLFVGFAIVMAVLGVFGGWGALLIGGVVYIAASLVYFVYTWTTMKASPGQKVLNLETVNAGDGAPLTRDQAIRRWAFLFGPSALAQVLSYGGGVLLGILGTLVGLAALGYAIYLLYTVTQSSKRQGFHDVQAGTVVVKRG